MSYHYRPSQRQISLSKFVRQAGDLLPPSLYIPYVEMLAGLANGPQCAHLCYNLLKTDNRISGEFNPLQLPYMHKWKLRSGIFFKVIQSFVADFFSKVVN